MFETTHADVCLENGWPWPIGQDALLDACGSTLAGLPQRAREVAFIAHKLHAMPDDVTVQFMDANCSFERLIRSNGCPWVSDRMMTIAGPTRAVMRSRSSSGQPVLRTILGRELLAMAGWGRTDFKQETRIDNTTLSSLAGNAFSAFACGPVLLACMSTLFLDESDARTTAQEQYDASCSDACSDAGASSGRDTD